MLVVIEQVAHDLAEGQLCWRVLRVPLNVGFVEQVGLCHQNLVVEVLHLKRFMLRYAERDHIGRDALVPVPKGGEMSILAHVPNHPLNCLADGELLEVNHRAGSIAPAYAHALLDLLHEAFNRGLITQAMGCPHGLHVHMAGFGAHLC